MLLVFLHTKSKIVPVSHDANTLFQNDKVIYFVFVIWQNTFMKNPIISELEDFFERNPDIASYHLAIIAKVHPTIVHNAITGKRKDMFSSTADKLRSAMREVDASLTATPNTPTEPSKESVHELA